MPLPALLAPLLSAIPGIASIFGGNAKGASEERDLRNKFAQEQDQTKANVYGTQQRALLDAVLQGGKDKMSAYDTRQGATTQGMQGRQNAWTQALGNESQEKVALAKLGQDAPGIAARQSILGSIMKNMQPHSFKSPARQQGHLTSVSGGLSAANLDPTTRAHGDALIQSAMAAQMNGGNLPKATNFREGIQDWDKAVLDSPEATDYSKGLMAPPKLQGYQNAGKGESGMSLASIIGGIGGQLLPPLLAGKGGGGDRELSNKMPVPYSGMNAAGVPNNYQLPQGDFATNPDVMANFQMGNFPTDDTFIDE